jgi:Domain of unknown function (DU1801)
MLRAPEGSMAKLELKTRPTDVSVDAFIEAVPDAQRREDAKVVRAMMERITGEPAVMWGPSIIGFGTYRYECGKDWGEMCRLGFSPRKAELVLYVLTEAAEQDAFLARLGKHKTGKSCLYLKKLSDVDMGVLDALTVHALDHMNRKYPQGA